MTRQTFFRRLRKINGIYWYVGMLGEIRGWKRSDGYVTGLLDLVLTSGVPWHHQLSHRDYVVLNVCSRNGETGRLRYLKRTREALLRAVNLTPTGLQNDA